MGITSNDIDTQSFSVDRKGYSIEEVDVFLEKVSKEVGLLNQSVNELKKNQDTAKDDAKKGVQEEIDGLNAEISKQRLQIEQLQAELAKKVDDGRAISEALIVAQRSADKIVTDANEKSKKIIKDANDKADYIEKDADQQKKRVMNEIEKLEKERIATQKEYQTMLRDIISAMEKHIHGADTKKDNTDNNVYAKPAQADLGATAKSAPVSQVAPAPVVPEKTKDFSGFGDADFGGDKID